MGTTPKAVPSVKNEEPESTIEGMLLDVDYLIKGDEGLIRLTLKGTDGKAYEVFDRKFRPYFMLVPSRDVTTEELMQVAAQDNGRVIKPTDALEGRRSLFGKEVTVFRIFTRNPSHVPKLSAAFSQFGTCYENDIPFARRWSVDNEIVPLVNYRAKVKRENGAVFLESFEGPSKSEAFEPNVMCFDIEVYNPLLVPRASRDPVIMISYSVIKKGVQKHGVITWRKVKSPFVECVADEKAMLQSFLDKLNEFDIDIIAGYNSANFDVKYLVDRSKAIGFDFNMSRFEGDTKIERHGLVDKVKVAGRVHVDMYLVVRFIAVVGAAAFILKLSSYTLGSVYEAVTQDKKFVELKNSVKDSIASLWDGGDNEIGKLAEYNLADADALQKIYDSFIAIMIEMSRVTLNTLSDVSVSTTGQLVEFSLMHEAVRFNEVIPNKPTEQGINSRVDNPIEGAYVKTPEPGVYSNLAMFDFRGLYPSIIISRNIDPSSLCTDCKEYDESPTGARFNKKRKSVMPSILKHLIDERSKVKQLYKKDPDNIFLGSRSQALKILSNSFYGYLGYARSRWYSRDCAASVTAWGRQYIKEVMDFAESRGFGVLYGDTDSIVILLNNKGRDEVLKFMKDYNAKLPESMELELEDFYTRGVFVGKKSDSKEAVGAKKKYALISESGRIKIRGFELVRRDWSKIARDTQKRVLESILKEGDPQKAAAIVRDVIVQLKAGEVPLRDLVINTQIRKSIDSYDVASPEIAAAKKAVKSGFKKKEELEYAVIGYIITKHGVSTSDKAQLEGMAQDYDADYYINRQVLPATMRILKELNFNEDQLKSLGTQKKL